MGAEIDSLEIRIETSASAANQQLERLASKLETVAANLGKVNTSSIDRIAKSLSGASSATQRTAQSTNNLQKFANAMDVLAGKSNKAGKSLSSFSQIAGNFYANSFLLVRAVKKLWNGVESSMDYVETFNYWNVTLDKLGKEFGNKFEDYGYESADAYAESFRDNGFSRGVCISGSGGAYRGIVILADISCVCNGRKKYLGKSSRETV